jgi:hypothetical protein
MSALHWTPLLLLPDVVLLLSLHATPTSVKTASTTKPFESRERILPPSP